MAGSRMVGKVSSLFPALNNHSSLIAGLRSSYSVAARVPLTPFPSATHYIAFSHGSLHPHLDILTPFPSSPNSLAHSLLAKALSKPMPPPYPPAKYPGLPKGTTDDEEQLYGGDGVVWWRGLAIEESEEQVCEWAKILQKRLGVRRVVGGEYSLPLLRRRAKHGEVQVILQISTTSLADAMEM